MSKILIVEDEEAIADLEKDYLELSGFEVEIASDGTLGLKKALEEEFQLVILDLMLPGVDGFEMDVQLSRDGEVVVFHDETLDRVTGYHGYLRDLTVSELKRLDASSGFRGLYGKNEIPTLREFLELVAPTELIVNMELKNNRQYYPQLEEKVIALVRAFGMEKRVIFSSFNNVSILRCRRLAPEIDAGFLWKGPVIGQAGQYCRDNDVQFFMPDGNYLSDDIVADFRAHGIRLAPWTANSLPEIRRLADWDVYCINTNYPNLRK